LIKALEDTDAQVRATIAEALEKIDDPRATSALNEYKVIKAREEKERAAREEADRDSDESSSPFHSGPTRSEMRSDKAAGHRLQATDREVGAAPFRWKESSRKSVIFLLSLLAAFLPPGYFAFKYVFYHYAHPETMFLEGRYDPGMVNFLLSFESVVFALGTITIGVLITFPVKYIITKIVDGIWRLISPKSYAEHEAYIKSIQTEMDRLAREQAVSSAEDEYQFRPGEQVGESSTNPSSMPRSEMRMNIHQIESKAEVIAKAIAGISSLAGFTFGTYADLHVGAGNSYVPSFWEAVISNGVLSLLLFGLTYAVTYFVVYPLYLVVWRIRDPKGYAEHARHEQYLKEQRLRSAQARLEDEDRREETNPIHHLRSEMRMSAEERAVVNKELPVLLTNYLGQRAEYNATTGTWTPVSETELLGMKFDAAIVLGSAITDVPVKAAGIVNRLRENNPAMALVTSGGFGPTAAKPLLAGNYGMPEALHFKNVMEANGAKVDIVEADSTSSGENVRFSRKKIVAAGLAPKRILLMQNAWGQAKAAGVFVTDYLKEEGKTLADEEITLVSYTPVIPDVASMSDADALSWTQIGLEEAQKLKDWPAKGWAAPVPTNDEAEKAIAALRALPQMRSEIREPQGPAEITAGRSETRQVETVVEGYPEEVILALKNNKKLEQSSALEAAYAQVVRRYPEFDHIPVYIKIVRGLSTPARVNGYVIEIEEGLLSYPATLMQVLASEHFGHLLHYHFLKTLEGREPTDEEKASMQLHSDLKWLEDFQELPGGEAPMGPRIPEVQASILEGLIRNFPQSNFFVFLLRSLRQEDAHTILRILRERETITEARYLELLKAKPFEGKFGWNRSGRYEFSNELAVIVESQHFYSQQTPFAPDLTGYFKTHDPVELQDGLENYRTKFIQLRKKYAGEKPAKVFRAEAYLGDIEINLGAYHDGLHGEVKVQRSADGNSLTLTRTDTGAVLHIGRVMDAEHPWDGKTLMIGNRLYEVDQGQVRKVDLYGLVHSVNPLQMLGNEELLNFAGEMKTPDVARAAFNQPVAGVHVVLYDSLKDPVSRIAEPYRLAPLPSAQALANARAYLEKHQDYSDSGEGLILRLHHLAVLAQSREDKKAGISAQQAMKDRILFTDNFEQIARNTQDPEIQKWLEEILFSVALLAVRETPAKGFASGVTLTTEEAAHLDGRVPFEITSAETSNAEFYRLQDVFRHAVATESVKGLQPYFVINIQNFTPKTYLAYVEFLREVSAKYNGKITFLLSIQPPFVTLLKADGTPESYKPLDHDRPGTYTSRRRVIDVFGEDFYKTEYIANISDGGEKTRGANLGVLHEQFSKVLTAEMKSFLEHNIQTGGVMWLMLPDLGRGKRLWLASDGRIIFGKINLGGKPLSQLPADFQVGIAGPAAPIMTAAQRVALLDLVEKRRMGWSWDGALGADPAVAAMYPEFKANFLRRRLNERGIYVTDAQGVLTDFREKQKDPRVVIQMAYGAPSADGGAGVVENIFFIIEDAETSLHLVEDLNRMPTGDKNRFLARKPVSVFQSLFGGVFAQQRGEKLVDPAGLEVFKKYVSKIYGIDYGPGNKVSDIADLEQYFLMWEQYLRDYGGRTYEYKVSDKVTVRFKGGDKEKLKSFLANAKFEGEGVVVIGDYVVVANSTIRLQGGELVIPDHTKIIDSTILGPVKFNGEAGVVVGVHFEPGVPEKAVRNVGEDKPAEVLEVYGDETVVLLDYGKGERYLVRMINSLLYKGETIVRLTGGFSRWDQIRAVLHFPSQAGFEQSLETPLATRVSTEMEWRRLVRMVFLQELGVDLQYDVRDQIWAIQKSTDPDETKIEKIENVLRSIPTARLILSGNGSLREHAARMLPVLDDEELRTAIRKAFDARFLAFISDIVVRVPFSAVSNLSYGEALYRIWTELHPRVFGLSGISKWEDVWLPWSQIDESAKILAYGEWQKAGGRLTETHGTAETRYLDAYGKVKKGPEMIDLRNYGNNHNYRDAKASLDAISESQNMLAVRQSQPRSEARSEVRNAFNIRFPFTDPLVSARQGDILQNPEVLYEGEMADVIEALAQGGKRSQSEALRVAYYRGVLKRYPEFQDIPVQIKIVKGLPVACQTNGQIIEIQEKLLDYPELLQLVLINTGYGNTLYYHFLRTLENRRPTVAERAGMQIHGALKWLEDFQDEAGKIEVLGSRSPEAQADILEALILDFDAQPLFIFLLRSLSNERRIKVVDILYKREVINATVYSQLRTLAPFEGHFAWDEFVGRYAFSNEQAVIVEVHHAYRMTAPLAPDLNGYFNSHDPLDMQFMMLNFLY
jgi:hypothetical protein